MGGYILGESGKSEAALQFYRRAIGLKLDLPAAWSNMGKLLFEQGRYAEALDAFEAALALRPGDADLWNSRAGALRQLGRLDESAEAAREALRLRPNFAEAALNLGNALLKLDRVAEALEAYRLASSIKPEFSAALCGQALALRASGPLRGSARRVRTRRTARQRRGDQRQRLPRSHARRFRTRLGRLRSALDCGKVARRGAGRALSQVARTGPCRRTRAGAERSRPRRHDPVRSLSADDDLPPTPSRPFCARRRLHRLLSSLARRQARREGARRRIVRRADRDQQPAARVSRRASIACRRPFPILRAEPEVTREVGRAHRSGGLQDRRRLAGQSQSGSRHGPLDAARRLRAARRERRARA